MHPPSYFESLGANMTTAAQLAANTMSQDALGWYCVGPADVRPDYPSPFGSVFMLFTFGYLAVVLLSIPLGILPLEDNIGVQMIAFGFTTVITGQWVVSSLFSGLDGERLPIWTLGGGDRPGIQTILGPIILNFAATVFVPSWINLKVRQ
jgi:hypothetical protein